MSACAGLGIDNLLIDITADEVPILDGSASSFVFLLQSARHPAAGRAAALHPGHASRSRCAKARAPTPSGRGWSRYHGYKLSFEIDFDHRVVNSTGQRVEFDLGSGSYSRDIARARTFGFTKEVEYMRSQGPGARRRPGQRDRDGRHQGAQCGRAALRRRVRQAQDPRRDGRPVRDRQAAAGRLQAPSARAMRSTTSCCANCSAHPDAYEVVTFDDEKRAPAGFAEVARAW